MYGWLVSVQSDAGGREIEVLVTPLLVESTESSEDVPTDTMERIACRTGTGVAKSS